MPARPGHIPVYRERNALQALVRQEWLPAAKLYPAGPSTIVAMLGKGWIERKKDAAIGFKYRITVSGRAAQKIVIPSKPHVRKSKPGS
jgi:hypothetical protein